MGCGMGNGLGVGNVEEAFMLILVGGLGAGFTDGGLDAIGDGDGLGVSAKDVSGSGVSSGMAMGRKTIR